MSLSRGNLIILESVDSTNNYAMATIKKGIANSGDAIFAIEQSAGKGRRGKAWQSKRGENILLSIIVKMQWLPVQQQFYLSIAVALSCRNFFSKYTKENIKVKWPNDIYISDRKAGGILIENIIKGNLWQWAIIGIGLNINQINFEECTSRATSLKQISGKHYNVIELSKQLHEMVLKNICILQEGNFLKMLSEYNKNLFYLDKTAKLKKGNVVFETKIKRVSKSGDLITKDTVERRFVFNEVQWIDI